MSAKSFYSLAFQPVFMGVWSLDHYGGRYTNTDLFVHSLPTLHISIHIRTHSHTCMYVYTHTPIHTHTHNTQSGETALHIAVQEEFDDIVELLLEANADPDLTDEVIDPYIPHTTLMVT